MNITLDRNKKIALGAAVVLLALIPFACQRKTPNDLENYLSQLKSTEESKPHVFSTKDVVMPAPYHYSADALREPFMLAGSSVVTQKTKPASPLEGFPLSQLQFVGTVTLNHSTFAYVQSPDNMLYQVHEGSLIGDRGGKVVSITPDAISIVISEQEGNKPAVEHIVSLQLKGST